MLFDSHTHVQFSEFDADRDAVVKRALEAGIWMINVGTNTESSKKAVELAYKYKDGVYPVREKSLPAPLEAEILTGPATGVVPEGIALSNGVYATVGIHPVRDEISNGASHHDAEAEYDFSQIEELARDPKVVGIGETGLDYFGIMKHETCNIKHEAEAKEKQKKLFIRHIELAQKVGKPLIIHCRDAHDDLLEILQAQFSEVQPPTTNNFLLSGRRTATNSPETGGSQRAEVEPRGVMHFFGGEGAWENLDKYLEMGFYISLAGVITFKKYGHYEDIKRIPLDRILIETDAPYVSPEPYRGKRNEPSYVKYVAEKLAEIKGISFEEAAEQTTQNARVLFAV